MSDNRNKKVVIIIVVLFILFGGSLIFLDKFIFDSNETPSNPGNSNPSTPSNPSNPSNPNNPSNPGTSNVNYGNFERVEDASDFFTVVNNISTYLDYLYAQNNEAVYNILAKKYINTNKIDVNNALVENIPFQNIINYSGLDMYYYNLDDRISVYYVAGEIKEDNSLAQDNTVKRELVYHKVVIDVENFTYNVTPINSLENFNSLISKTKVSDIETSIAKNSYNTFKFQNISTDTLISNYYYNFLNKLMYEPKEAYKLLNETYRTAKFGTFEKFQEYLYDNLKELGSATIASYRYQNGLQKIYYVYNSQGDVIIFKENSIMNYEVYLDDQTVSI